MQAPVPHRLPCVVRINAGVRQGDNVLLFNITNISTVVTTERTPPPSPLLEVSLLEVGTVLRLGSVA